MLLRVEGMGCNGKCQCALNRARDGRPVVGIGEK
jgi:hypothetical protein